MNVLSGAFLEAVAIDAVSVKAALRIAQSSIEKIKAEKGAVPDRAKGI